MYRKKHKLNEKRKKKRGFALETLCFMSPATTRLPTKLFFCVHGNKNTDRSHVQTKLHWTGPTKLQTQPWPQSPQPDCSCEWLRGAQHEHRACTISDPLLQVVGMWPCRALPVAALSFGVRLLVQPHRSEACSSAVIALQVALYTEAATGVGAHGAKC